MVKRIFFFLLIALFVFDGVSAQTRRFTIQELLRVRRVGDPQVSPDGRWVAFTIGDVDRNANKIVTNIYRVSIEGGAVKQLTNNGTTSSSTPRWSPDGRKIAFTSGGQIWTMDADGDDKKQVTKISTGAANPVWSPDGRIIAFNSDIYPECNGDDKCNARKEEQAETNKVKAHVTDRLLYKHWNEWRDVKRTHVFVVNSNGDGLREITNGDWDAPPYGASTGIDYAFSPDSRELGLLRNPDKVQSIWPNRAMYTVAVTGHSGMAKNITASNKGYDAAPIYTRDGNYIIYRSQATAGFESDRWRLMRYDRATQKSVEIPTGFNLMVEDVAVSPDSKTIYFTAGERARQNVYSVPVMGGRPKKLGEIGFVGDLRIAPDGRTLVFTRSTLNSPTEIGKMSIDGTQVGQITAVNAEFMRQFGLQPVEDFEWMGAANTKIHGFINLPANFDQNKKYPLIVLIHGGPQGAWNDAWSYRWNAQVFADAGYVVFSPNPRGSTGYGQKLVNEISGDWGGKAYVDIMNGVAALINKKNYIDKNRIGGAGASYGGYMVDWILGHNNDPRFRFKVLLSHAGVYNLESMAGATEELWFTNWEFKGAPWENPAMYARWSPHKFVKNFKTPTLITHGELDYRVPVDQSMQLFTALQLQNVESKLIIFPDEGHWILKPQNSEFWYTNVLDWFNKHLQP